MCPSLKVIKQHTLLFLYLSTGLVINPFFSVISLHHDECLHGNPLAEHSHAPFYVCPIDHAKTCWALSALRPWSIHVFGFDCQRRQFPENHLSVCVPCHCAAHNMCQPEHKFGRCTVAERPVAALSKILPHLATVLHARVQRPGTLVTIILSAIQIWYQVIEKKKKKTPCGSGLNPIKGNTHINSVLLICFLNYLE